MTGIQDFFRGDTKKYTLKIRSKVDQAPISVHGGKLTVTFKKKATAPDIEALLQVVVDCTEPDQLHPQGIIRVILPADKTSIKADEYFYDFQFVSSTGEVTTILQGKVKVLQDVTMTSV